MKKHFRIHGDNIIECERIAKILLDQLELQSQDVTLSSPSTITLKTSFHYKNSIMEWRIDLLPGFNKAGRSRWEKNIFDILKINGSFLDETPDAIVTEIKNDKEWILFALEFCSALQAGNQAWQRSGRAYSTGITGCPYIYIVDFVKYELNASTRERKALRFPNAAVPYSYISFSKNNNLKVVQAYFKAEEFNKEDNKLLKDFDDNNFAKDDFAEFVINTMLEKNANKEWESLTQKNFNVVQFLANVNKSKGSFTAQQWKSIYQNELNVLDYSKSDADLPFWKKVAKKSKHGNHNKFFSLVKKHSIGIASKDLPFGVISAAQRQHFSQELKQIYPTFNNDVLTKIGCNNKDLLICLLKGFKPGGDDNRPDRGALPFAQMLVGQNCDVMTFLYGPILERNFSLLNNNPKQLAKNNGLWNVLISLSDFIAIDANILNNKKKVFSTEIILKDVQSLKKITTIHRNSSNLVGEYFPGKPKSYHEDDVDTAIHYLFSHILKECCFESLCNPPGGDWSGFSIIDNQIEKRWLSLPRESKSIAGKRPDHILELFDILDKPILLIIESKEFSNDLEDSVGTKLIEYLKKMMSFVPSVVRSSSTRNWERSKEKTSFDDFYAISAAAYLGNSAETDEIVFKKSQCDMLFKLWPVSNVQRNGWNIEISCSSSFIAKSLKDFLEKSTANNNEIQIISPEFP